MSKMAFEQIQKFPTNISNLVSIYEKDKIKLYFQVFWGNIQGNFRVQKVESELCVYLIVS